MHRFKVFILGSRIKKLTTTTSSVRTTPTTVLTSTEKTTSSTTTMKTTTSTTTRATTATTTTSTLKTVKYTLPKTTDGTTPATTATTTTTEATTSSTTNINPKSFTVSKRIVTSTMSKTTRVKPTSSLKNRTCPRGNIKTVYDNTYAYDWTVILTDKTGLYFVEKDGQIQFGPIRTRNYLPYIRIPEPINAAYNTLFNGRFATIFFSENT